MYNPAQMRKLRILLAEVIGLGLLIGWLMWKYPELVDDIIPWVALLVVWHFTWEFVLDTRAVRRVAISVQRQLAPMLAWILVFFIGGTISCLYWAGINKSLSRLASVGAQRAEGKKSRIQQQSPARKIAPEDEAGLGPESGMTDSISTMVSPATPKGGAMIGDFQTSGRGEYEVDTFHVAPEELSFTPPGTVLQRDKLPAKVLVSEHNLTILRFTDNGFVVDDNGWRNLRIRVAH
jgi:hypothetical protein